MDRRQVLVSLTPEAEAVAERDHAQRLAIVEGALRQLTPPERRAFVKGLDLLATGAQTWLDSAPIGEVHNTLAEKEAALA
jgi:DNA-binding MarR family transcriptional regulator